jgi:predicted ATP-grasp superfamily ATP-dependent carboligase
MIAATDLEPAPHAPARGWPDDRETTRRAARAPATDAGHPPALLTVASYYGTLAAARCLGRAGIPVTLAGAPLLAPARWSRFVTRREPCPPVEEPERFVEWLLRFGEREPGHVLYPTSDDVAWLLSLHRDELARRYHLFQPPFETLRRLLDKRELFAVCREVGIAAPVTHFPDDARHAAEIARHAAFPLLIKPTTQVLLRSHHKGVVVPNREALPGSLDAYRALTSYHPYVLARMPGADRPMLQEFHPRAAVGIYSVAGFVSASGAEGVVALAARKVLQRPRRIGIGLCFEEAALRPELAERLAALCRAVGFHGVFEAEFIEADGEFLLIDFNPRFYSQMAFEVDRGLPLPLLAYEAALGRSPVLRDARRALRDRAGIADDERRVYTHRVILGLVTTLQRLAGAMSPAEAARWRAWYRSHRRRVSDAVLDRGDRLPALVDVVSTLVGYGRHPRWFVRSMVLDR